MKPLDILRELKLKHSIKEHPNVPYYALPLPKYEDKTANGLTRCVIEFLMLSGHFAERVNTMGTARDNRKVVTDVLGRKKTIGSIVWTKTNAVKGSADVHSEINVNINGQKIPIAVKWEIKIGRDRQSKDQKNYESQVGNYFIIKTFDDFYQKYTEFINRYS